MRPWVWAPSAKDTWWKSEQGRFLCSCTTGIWRAVPSPVFTLPEGCGPYAFIFEIFRRDGGFQARKLTGGRSGMLVGSGGGAGRLSIDSRAASG